MAKLSIPALFFAACLGMQAQNNLRLQLGDGAPFTVLVDDRPYNPSPEAEVLMTGISEDTLRLKIALADGNRYGVIFYLLDRGRPANGREFSYVLRKVQSGLRPRLLEVCDIEPLQRRKP